MSYKDKVVGNELDLSLIQLEEVPVKELAKLQKVTRLDLSCNLIQILPNEFSGLTQLVKIDLSRNKLIELPHNFGNLLNLQELELDKNELKTLPLSFCRLKNLRWLDLKDNPLDAKLKTIAGDCLDEKQCQLCAKKVVSYMQSVESNIEREKQRHLKEKREKEAVEKAKIDKEMEEQRIVRKMEKERRKAESKVRNEERLKQKQQHYEKDSSQSETDSKDDLRIEESGASRNWLIWITFLFIIAVGCVAVYYHTSSGIQYHLSKADLHSFAKAFWSLICDLAIDAWKSLLPYLNSVKLLVLKNIHAIFVFISNLATDIELLLSIYF